MKTCVDCNLTQDQDLFPIGGSKGRRSTRCKPCKQAYDRNWYLANKDSTSSRRKETRPVIKLRNYNLVLDYLKDNPCIACGETDPIVLDFDHRDPKTKSYNVSAMIARHSAKALFEEIAKCDVMCSNCHRRKTAKQFGWYAFAQE